MSAATRAAPGGQAAAAFVPRRDRQRAGDRRDNVARLFAIAVKSPEQLVYYDPGVGTMGARSATTRAGKALTRVGGLVLGHGIKDNLEEAYRWLMNVYQPGTASSSWGSAGARTRRSH